VSAAATAWRIGRWFLLGVAGLLVLALLALTVLMVTPAGARWAISQGLSRSPVPVTVGAVSGTLRGPLVLEDIRTEKDGLTAEVGRLVFDWRPLQLLRKRVVIDSLHVDGIEAFVPEGWSSGAEPASEAEADTAAGPPRATELPVEVVVGDLRIGIDRLNLESVAEIDSSSLTGRGSPEAFELEAELRGRGEPISDFRSQLSLSGAPEDYRLQSELAFTSGDLPPVTGTLEAAGSLTEIAIEQALLRTASGTAKLVSRVAWYPEITWELTAEAAGLDIAPFTPSPEEWPGTLSFRADSEGRIDDAGPTASVRVDGIAGEVRGQALGGGLRAEIVPGRVDLDTLGLTWGTARIAASGLVADELDLAFDLEVPDLGVVLPEATGSVQAAGTVSGTREFPALVAEFEATEVRTPAGGVGRARGDVALDLSDGMTSEVEIRAETIAAGENAVDSVVVRASGTRPEHALSIRAHAADVRFATGLSGGLSEGGSESGGESPSWEGRLDSLVVFAEPTGEWRLAGSAPIRASADAAALEPACLAQEGSEVCVEGTWEREGPTAGALRITALPLALAQELLPEGMEIDGEIDGDARVAMAAGGTLSGDGVLTLEGTLAATVGEATRSFRLGGDGLGFRIDASGTAIDLAASLTPESDAGDLTLQGRVALPGYNSTAIALEEQPIEGAIEIRSDDLSFLSAFSPEVEDAGGRMRIESAISGTAAAPEVRGSLALEDGLFDLPSVGLELRDLELQAAGDPEGGIEFTGSVRSGDGTLELAGRSPVEPSPEAPAELTISGEEFLAMNTPEIQVEIAPDLAIGYDGALTRVEGRVAIPWTRIEIVETPPSAVAPSNDVVFVDEEAPTPPEVDARIEVVIGDDVQFEGFGFSSGIEGELRVRQEPGSEPTALGEIRFVDGRFASYGQNLDIDPGRVVFSGPIADAALEVTATRTATDGTVAGFLVTGNIASPEVELTSDPAMSDADALSYIMYGKDMNEGDPSQQEQVAGAVAALGANVVTTQLASKVGLDEARIEGATKDQAELVAGKYLTPSLFVSYGLGLFKPSNTFRIKYLLSSHWAVQAESGDANGGDVLYQIERGR
jgi:translocation and assembly module TamB